jgi:toxin ParE1/3/4
MRGEPHVVHEIIWRPEARDDLYAIYDWIADQADPDTAYAYTSRIEVFVLRLSHFPNRGTPRFDLSSGLRSVTFERRIIIAYRVESDEVRIVRLIDSARDFARAFRDS